MLDSVAAVTFSYFLIQIKTPIIGELEDKLELEPEEKYMLVAERLGLNGQRMSTIT